MEEIREKFAMIEDWRHGGYVTYQLADILVIVFCAVLCGMKGLTDVHTYADNNAEYFKEYLNMETMISRAELGRILAAMDADAVGSVMVDVLKERLGVSEDVVAVDGKAIRSTAQDGRPHSALQILTLQRTRIMPTFTV